MSISSSEFKFSLTCMCVCVLYSRIFFPKQQRGNIYTITINSNCLWPRKEKSEFWVYDICPYIFHFHDFLRFFHYSFFSCVCEASHKICKTKNEANVIRVE